MISLLESFLGRRKKFKEDRKELDKNPMYCEHCGRRMRSYYVRKYYEITGEEKSKEVEYVTCSCRSPCRD